MEREIRPLPYLCLVQRLERKVGLVEVVNSLIWTDADTLFASLARTGMINMRVAMLKQHNFSDDAIWARFDTFPARLALSRIELYVFRLQVSM